MQRLWRMAFVMTAIGLLGCFSGFLPGCEVAYDEEESLPEPTTAPGPAPVERGETTGSDLEDAAGSAIDAAESRSGSYLGQARDAAERTVGAVEERSRAIGDDSP